MATPVIDFLRQPLHRPLPTGPVTFEEFIEWCDEDVRAEWVEGGIELMPSPASIEHQDIAGFLYSLLLLYTNRHGGGKAVLAPYVMKLARIARGREPDLLYVRPEHTHLITRNYLDGPADLAVEIVSPESKKRDRQIKFEEYARAGVAEYWLIDPTQRTAEFYWLDATSNYQKAALDAAGCYHARSVSGLRLRIAWLWQVPLPDPLDALQELQLI